MYAVAIHRPENMVKFVPPPPTPLRYKIKWFITDKVVPVVLLMTAWLNIYVGLMVVMGR